MRILTLNNGSSSLKAALYDLSEGERLVLMAEAPRFGVAGGSLRINDGNDNTLHEDTRDLDDHESVMRVLFEWLDQHPQYNKIDAIGHRVVHGGPHFSRPQRVTPDLIDALEKLDATRAESSAGVDQGHARHPQVVSISGAGGVL